MKIGLNFFIAALLMSHCAAQNITKLDQVPNLGQQIDTLVRQYQDLDIFSGVVLVAEQGKPVYHKAFGLADRESKRKNTLDTKFDIGSMNKAFTKVVILRLVSQGKLHLDDLLGKFLDGFDPVAGQKVTVQMLLEHTSGFGDYFNAEYQQLTYEQKQMNRLVELIRKMPLLFEPGTDRQYSNAGYLLLGAIIEKVTGKDFLTVVDEMIVQPMGMHDTFVREKYQTPERAIGYTTTMRGNLEANDFLQDPPSPAGGFYSTTSDMLKFFRAYHYGTSLWDEATRKLDPMYGFLADNMDSGGAITHAGGFPGANTVHYEVLRDGISILVFANMDEPVAEKLGFGILSIIRGKVPEKPVLPAHRWVYQAYREKGIDYVRENFETLTANWTDQDPKDMLLNMIGYNLLYSDDASELDQAIEIFSLNAELFPEVANVWDSLGEAWLKKGDKQKALTAYKKALAIRPDLPSALAAVKQLEKE